MAIDSNFLTFLVPAIIVVLAAVVAFPSKGRIERDPSTAYGGGRRALVTVAALFALLMGAILAGLGSTQNVEEVVAGLNMVHIGGISLIAMAIVLIATHAVMSGRVKRAAKGDQEMVLEVAPVRPIPPPSGASPPRGPPPRDLPPRSGPPPPRNKGDVPLPPRVPRRPPPPR